MIRYILSRLADDSLADIENYTAERWGDAQAEKYIGALFAAFARLAEDPAMGRRRTDIPPSLLVYGVGSHLIVYRSGDGGEVEVVTILHPAMNVAKHIEAALAARKP